MTQAKNMATMAPAATPFPWMPMLAIAIGLISHSYSLSSLFPYVGFMVQQLGVAQDKDEAGYYAGYLSSALMAGRFVSSYFWGRFADRYGRLPVMYFGLCSIATFSIAFGLSTTFWWAITCRFLLGALNGLVAIGKCLISEVCGKEHETVGMSFVTACWSIGLVFGPAIGGLLAETTNKGLFGRFPYLLPNIVGASLAISGLPMFFFFVKETGHLDNGRGNGGGSAGFKPLATSEPDELDTRDAEMEEGRGKTLELTPLTQANSLDDGGNDDDEALAELLGGSLEEPTSARVATFRSSSPSRTGQRGLDVHSEARRDVSEASDSRMEGGGGWKANPNHDERVPENFDVEDRTARGVISRECLMPMKLLQEKRVRAILFIYAAYSFACIGYGEVYPLWALSTVARGGLDWTTKQIGQFIDMGVDATYPLWAISSVRSGGVGYSTNDVGKVLSLCGVGMLIFQLLVYPRLSKRMGVTMTQRWGCLLSIPVYLTFPFLSRLHDSGAALVVASIVFNFLSNVTATALFINIALATNNAVDPARRATLNGLSMMLGSLAKAAGPAVFSAIFAWSIDGNARPFPLDFHLVFYVLALSMAVVTWASWNVITGDLPPRLAATEAKASTAPDDAHAED